MRENGLIISLTSVKNAQLCIIMYRIHNIMIPGYLKNTIPTFGRKNACNYITWHSIIIAPQKEDKFYPVAINKWNAKSIKLSATIITHRGIEPLSHFQSWRGCQNLIRIIALKRLFNNTPKCIYRICPKS